MQSSGIIYPQMNGYLITSFNWMRLTLEANKGKLYLWQKKLEHVNLLTSWFPRIGLTEKQPVWFLEENIAPYAKLNTDGASIYKQIGKWWPVYHIRYIHRRFEFEHTSKIEGMFGVMRTFIRRMYHHVTPDKLGELIWSSLLKNLRN